ncbi:polymer-forming cytoskeletal protein [Moorella naiadis]|uniref:bactofilin family protein n=1 Tax=Moorella naiadis (nom. illeg.) TaxID=3093670 RepID=UPI003D9C9B80
MLGKKNNAEPTMVDTVIGKGARVTGKLVSGGAIRIDGALEGEVVTEGDLVVGENGQVIASVRARNLLVVGGIKGDVVAGGQLEIAPTGRIDGDVQTGRLIVEPGGLLRGHCQMPLPEDRSQPDDGRSEERDY